MRKDILSVHSFPCLCVVYIKGNRSCRCRDLMIAKLDRCLKFYVCCCLDKYLFSYRRLEGFRGGLWWTINKDRKQRIEHGITIKCVRRKEVIINVIEQIVAEGRRTFICPHNRARQVGRTRTWNFYVYPYVVTSRAYTICLCIAWRTYAVQYRVTLS